jgi:hypothetical protein
VHPSIRYAGRLAGDPPGEMPQAEATIIAGTGSQTGTGYRWGDYSMMAVDPTDDCTFWYTTEYIQTTGTATWQTRVASYKFPSCISGPSGTLTGLVTNAGTGEPIAGASVTAGVYSAATNSSGEYTILMAPGTYDVTASKFGYAPETVTGVEIVEDGTTTQDFALVASETSAIDGYVTDQGHGWPLWAKVEVSLAPIGASAPVAPVYSVFTDPFTGYYDLGEVVGGQDYVFTVTPMYPGYVVMNRPVTANPGEDQTQNFIVPPTGACSAAGYVKQYGAAVYSENWDSVTWPALPTGWAVVRTGGTSTSSTWATRNNTRYPSGRGVHSAPNLVFFNSFTVTTGNSARLYRNTTGVDLSAVPFPTVRFWMYHDTGYTSSADRVQVQVSTDAGATWQNVGAPVNRYLGTGINEWRQHEVALEGFTGPLTDVRIGFNGISAYGNDVHLDEFEILSAPCVAVGGGMMAGFTTDANTGAALNGVRVAHDLGLYFDSMATPADPNLADGFYYLFAPIPGLGPATRTFTATKSGYVTAQTQFTVVPNTTSRLDFEMDAGMLSMSPATLYSRLYAGETEVQGLSMDNTGGAPADFKIYAVETAPWVPSLPQDPIVVTVAPERANDMTTRLLPDDSKDAPQVAPYAAGDVISSFPTTLAAPWGVGVDQFNNMVWAANILQGGGDDKNHEFTFTGTKTGDTILVQFGGSWPGDMAFDPLNNKMWQVNVGGDNCIYEWDVATLTKTGNKICWGATISERGLAYDMVSDTFFVGGWNTDAVTRFNRAGQVLQTKALAGSAISGLAVNPATGHVFVMQNSPTDAVLVLDANDNLNQIGTFTIAGFGNYAGAGLEFDCNGHLWATNQLDKKLYEIDSGETGTCPFLGNLPWFELDPLEGTVAGNSSFPIDATFIADGATHYGLWQANVSVIHNTPYAVSGAHACLVKAFDDMAEGAFADAYVHGLAGARISQGCGGGNFCPSDVMTRGVMARWLLNGRFGPDYSPPPCTGIFSDVPCESTPNADHIEALYNEGITGGCYHNPETGERRYCPNDPVLRSQMAVFLLKAKEGSEYTPPPCTGLFGDVACPGGFAVDWIEELYNRGITAGCGGGNFCPNSTTLRSQMSVFVVKNWEIPICEAPPSN